MPTVTLSNLSDREHIVQFYQKDAFLLDALVDFMRVGLASGAACILIATSAHREALEQRLQLKQSEPSSAQGTYFALDVASTLAQILVDGEPDPERFTRVIGDVIEQAAASGQKRVCIFTEMSTLLWQQDKQGTALLLESLWNDLCRIEPACSLLCAYPTSLFVGPGHEKPFTQVCELHSRVVPDEGSSAFALSEVRQRAVNLFHQKALFLDKEIAASRAAEERLRISEERYRRLFETSTDGILIVNPHYGLIEDANPLMLRILGSPREQVVNQQLWQIGLMPDQPSQQAFFERVQQERGTHSEVTQLLRKDGRVRSIEWVSTLFQVEGRAMLQCHVRDITDRLRAEEGLLYLAAIVSSSGDAIVGKDLSGIITSWNPAAERIYGYSESEVLGQPITLLFPPDSQQEEFLQIMERIRRGERVEDYETIRVRKDGKHVHVSLTISPIKNSSGTVIGVSGIGRDITERKRAEKQERFLSEVSCVLSSTLDYRATLANIARLVVPELADWFSVALADANGHFELVQTEHRDQELVKLVRAYREKASSDPDAPSGVPHVLRTGQSELYPEITDEMLVTGIQTEERLALARQIGIHSAMNVPLVARGKTIGVVTFVSSKPSKKYDKRDLALAEEVGRRAGLALDHARLHREIKQARDQLMLILQGMTDG